MRECPHHLLMQALLLPDPQAADAWRNWRATADLDRLDPASFYLLPGLSGRLPEWVSDDPRRAVLLGICRRAWSQNQVRLKLLGEAIEILQAAGIHRTAATGPVLWGALYWPERAVRPIEIVDLLVEPDWAWAALEAMLGRGWTPQTRMPDRSVRAFPFEPAVLFRSPGGGEVRLHWRAVPNTDFSLRRPPVLELCAMPPGHVAPYSISAEHALVASLSGTHWDAMDWRCDALLISRQIRDWNQVAALLRWRSLARDRLAELGRDWGAEFPAAAVREVWSSGVERALAASLQRYRRVKAAWRQ